MKFPNRAIAVLFGSVAMPAAAQYNTPPAAQPTLNQPPQAAAPTQAVVKPSKGAHKAILDLQAAVNAGDAAAIAEKLSAAQAVASSKEDRYLIAQLQLKAALARKDYASASSALTAIRSSGYLPSATVVQLYRGLAADAYSAKQYDQAASLTEGAIALDPQNGQLQTQLAEIRIAQGRGPEGIAMLQRAIQAQAAAGQKPSEDIYRRAVQAAYNAKLPAAVDISRDWLTAYPSKDSWRNAIAIYRNMNKPDVEGTLALLRLTRAAGALTPADMTLYAAALEAQSNFIEAQTALDTLAAANAGNAQISDLVREMGARPRPTVAELNAAAKSAQSGTALLRVGDRLYGLGEYAKAVELYRQAMGKPGVDSNVANMHIGMALAGAGDKAGAVNAFNAVGGALAGPAKYWLLFLNSRG